MGRRKRQAKDKLSLWAEAAQAEGMSYGKWVALHHPTLPTGGADLPLPKKPKTPDARKTKCYREDPGTGERKYYDSIRDAADDGYEPALVSDCIRGLRPSHGGYTWHRATKEHYNGSKERMVAVIGVDAETGREVRYESLNAAEADGFTAHCISSCIHGRQITHKGYYWYRETGKPHKELADRQIPIIGIDVETGQEIRYESLKAAAADGFNKCSISDCIHGRQLSHKGYRWQKEDENNE